MSAEIISSRYPLKQCFSSFIFLSSPIFCPSSLNYIQIHFLLILTLNLKDLHRFLMASWTKFDPNSCILYLLIILSRLGNFRHYLRFPLLKSLTHSHIIISSCISLILSTFLLAKLLFLSKIRTENLNTVFRNTI